MAYHIWLLNATESLLDHSPFRRKVSHILGDKIIWEQRSIEGKNVTNLLPDKEYFVPIAIKSLGDLWDNTSDMTLHGQQIVRQLKKLYFDRWKLPHWSTFWDASSDFHMMQTPIGKGYYTLIKERHKQGDKHILIGYSQGGVVARFLAFLDEYVYGSRLIDAVITIASPLKGSPLADPSHRETVTDAMIKILLGFFSFYESYGNTSGFTRILKRLKQAKFEDMYGFLSEWIQDSLSLGCVSPYYSKVGQYLFTFQKWLSGLQGNRESAFWELSPARLLHPFSVLGLIQHPLRTHLATIITANHSVEEIAMDYFALVKGEWIRFFWKCLKKWLFSQPFGGKPIRDNLAYIQDIYDYEIMNIDNNDHHDFMVPCGRQYIEKTPDLGLFSLPQASHLSGKDPTSQGGKEIIRTILLSLRRYAQCQK